MALTINSVSVSPAVLVCGQSYFIDVNVTADADDVEDGSAYRLFVFVNHNLVSTNTGHLQEAPWIPPTYTFHIPVTAGPGPDIYDVRALLLEGPKGVDPDGYPSFGSAGPIAVACP